METDVIHCHICYTMKIDEDWICERCDQHYCEECSATMTYHNQLDYSCCCCDCSNQQHKHIDLIKDIDKNLIELEKEEIKRKYEERKRKIDELMAQFDGKNYSELIENQIIKNTIIKNILDKYNKIYLKNNLITNDENVNYLLEMFGKPTFYTMENSCCLEIDLNEKTWRYMFDYEILYMNYDFIDLQKLKQIIRDKNLKELLN